MRTRAFARRQLAWFRRDPRIVWLDPEEDSAGAILALLAPFPATVQRVGGLYRHHDRARRCPTRPFST